ncbi:FAD-dependent oxidoreductase [Rhizobium sp. BK251]|uniref:FAD-dependent oxidoreductase n=1 Tax=Rhizobium sp. BK251 TaxID=2512125 RepID=UPI00104953CA|nr:FAD-dependent oxidoreductase [Rhizobium sp. BK251]TCL67194.1 2-polyprenyl-6-methoxyphenol hydroxylase-like FAD-dependent oxidoreductase [Rhizobium sp. BK251]
MKILIVGAGIAGLSTARALALKGLECEVIERRQEPPTEGAGIFLLGNASRALGDLGLLGETSSLAYPIATQRILSSSGAVLNHVRTDDVWKNCGPCLALSRQSLVDVLQKSLDPGAVRYGLEVTSIASRADRRIVRFSDGREEKYDLVIGAAGVNSLLRNMAFGADEAREVGISCWRLVVPNNGEIVGWTAMLGKGRTLLGIPISKSETYIYADCGTDEFSDGSLATLKRLFSDFRGPLGAVVAALYPETRIHRAKLQEVPAKRWIKDGLILIGDAGHASSPSMAQGAGMAIEDAVVLAEMLSRPGQIEEALQRFHDARIERIAWVQKKSQDRDKLRNSSSTLRNAVLRLFGNALYRKTYEPLTRALLPSE